jgi:hypothetical protein
MRQPRIKGQGQSFYHCVSRVVDGRFLFQTQSPGSVEAEHFVHLMRRLEKACCVQVLTYALMANHFHVLCKESRLKGQVNYSGRRVSTRGQASRHRDMRVIEDELLIH